MNQFADYNQIFMATTLGHDEEQIRFWRPSPKVTAGLKLPNLSQKVFVCMLSHEPPAVMLPNACLYYWDRINS